MENPEITFSDDGDANDTAFALAELIVREMNNYYLLANEKEAQEMLAIAMIEDVIAKYGCLGHEETQSKWWEQWNEATAELIVDDGCKGQAILNGPQHDALAKEWPNLSKAIDKLRILPE